MSEFHPIQRTLIAVFAVLLLGGIGLAARRNTAPPVTFTARPNVAPAPPSLPPPGSAPAVPSPDPAPASTSEGIPPAAAVPPSQGDLVVHVAGAVKTPGVYSFRSGKRVVDALHAAGGPTRDADLEALNLASRIADGQQILVPRKGQAVVGAAQESGSAGGSAFSAGGGGGHAAPTRARGSSARSGHRNGKPAPGPVSINTASLEQLEALPGVGPSTAQKILDYRSQHGRFAAADDLRNVKGIGLKKLEKMRPYVVIR